MDTSIEKAYEKYLSVTQDREMLHRCQMREMAIIDYDSGISNATRKGEQRGMQKGIVIGEQRGLQKGIQQVQAKYVLKLSQKGMPVEDIAELIDLSVEEVTKILNAN
jgi:predicted transposase/invertase (TIGR01784 family)